MKRVILLAATMVLAVAVLSSLTLYAIGHPSTHSWAALTAADVNQDEHTGAHPDGINPPHAADINGKVIPPKSTTQPDKPIILAKDSKDKVTFYMELKKEAAFDHVNHSTKPSYSIDGKAAAACTVCHHTDQPKAPADQPFLKTFLRDVTLTTKQLEESKKDVMSCRACHHQKSFDDEDSPESVKYPDPNKEASGTLYNDKAYHLNCFACHDAANANANRATKSKAPASSKCDACHVQQKP